MNKHYSFHRWLFGTDRGAKTGLNSVFVALLSLVAALPTDGAEPSDKQETPTSIQPRVLAVYNKDIYRENPQRAQTNTDKGIFQARRGASIVVQVEGLNDWLLNLRPLPKGTNDEERIKNGRDSLILYLNDTQMVGCRLDNSIYTANSNILELEFALTVDQSNEFSKKAWKTLLAGRLLDHLWKPYQLKVTIGTDTEYMDTEVDRATRDKAFSLEVIPHEWYSLAGAFFLLLMFIWFFNNLDLIKDHQAPLRPDASAPFSLARTQMAFWFFLVLTSYLIMWYETGQEDTITSSVLVLIGISSGTMLAATFVDKGKLRAGGRQENTRRLAAGQSPQQLMDAIEEEKQQVLKEYNDRRLELLKIAADQTVLRENNLKEQKLLEERVDRLQLQADFYRANAWRRFTSDMLGDNGVFDFHRFQIVAWTLVLGVIFVKDVVSDLAMPEFSPTLLGLMGISSGTYIGMKLPEGTK